eukprot:TRINITY_DN14748_c0_g1_i1.p1 TRINITY_DN14748_c0_g1~~TRINITY_DN14748_c0_g1_i1.p1  ORF type:complete len:628 (+),score=114.85 TRINITY_DN14748_c0_g1_i1:95-1885(+)
MPNENRKKKVVYQVFTRLFGNKNTTNKPWGTIQDNGVGKFHDFTDIALTEIKKLGITHIWYTGVLHHALINDYTSIGLSNDHPRVVKGRAGSPYAIKDYYSVNPDLASDPANRHQEFESLVERTHKTGLKVIIDIVPNHVARKYEGKNNPLGVRDFGADDDTSVEYKRDNDFYYLPGVPFEAPRCDLQQPLGGEERSDGDFIEFPAKWTGNGSRNPRPDINDWYETVKINYGIGPDGSKDFPVLPEGYHQKDYKQHFEFWKDKETLVPSSWKKFRDIALFWVRKGIDGFRYDMAEMVPCEFWSFLNSSIKMMNPESFLLAEIYNPAEYRNYIHLGKMDHLYDKVELYDTLKDIIHGKSDTDQITEVQKRNSDIDEHLLHFLENHDEQRLASPEFAGSGEKGKPLMVISAAISRSPVLIYFGQEVGEPAQEDGGFGKASRTSIFDYVGVPTHQRWMNDGKFDGGLLTQSEKSLREFYQRLLSFLIESPAMMGEFRELNSANRDRTWNYERQIYSFVRWCSVTCQKIIVVVNISSERSCCFELRIPADIISLWNLEDGTYLLKDQLTDKCGPNLLVQSREGLLNVEISPLESFIFSTR